ncbi:MAG: amino acid ABC transporter substrate-binding protein [Devosia sp.]
MTTLSRRTLLQAMGTGALATALAGLPTFAQDRTAIRIGYAVSKTGANAGGAGISTIPNYLLWVDDVNKAGGLELSKLGVTLPLEVTEYDDRSSAEETVRAIERLATQDNVDFILPSWGTGSNLAAGPTFDRFGFPQLAGTAVTDMAPQLAQRWKNSFWFLGGGHDYANALVDLLVKQRDAGAINNKVAIASVADGFGIDLSKAATPAFQAAGFELVYDKTYPLGTADFAPIINEVSGLGVDTFVAFSYPPDTFALTQQAVVANFSPKVFYLGVGTAFPIYPNVAGPNHNGVMGVGGIDPDSEAIAAYFERHTALVGQAPDSWASAVTYASLEILGQAITRVGDLDKTAVAAEIASGEFDTILGKVKLVDNQLRALWTVGQWQDGKFVGLAHTEGKAAREPVVPKPAWVPAS